MKEMNGGGQFDAYPVDRHPKGRRRVEERYARSLPSLRAKDASIFRHSKFTETLRQYGLEAFFRERAIDETMSPYESAIARELNSRVHEALDSLDEKEAEAIRVRFGMDGEQDRTDEEAASVLKISVDTFRRREATALAKLSRLDILRSLV